VVFTLEYAYFYQLFDALKRLEKYVANLLSSLEPPMLLLSVPVDDSGMKSCVLTIENTEIISLVQNPGR